MRRVVTGIMDAGSARFVEDGEAPTIAADVAPPGINVIWGADDMATAPLTGEMPAYERHFPPVGGYRLITFVINPDAEGGKRPSSNPEELEKALPGFSMDIEHVAGKPGLHRTATVDIGLILEGSVVLELDSGESTVLRTGDWFVQNRTFHAWRNPYDAPCRMAIFVVGAA